MQLELKRLDLGHTSTAERGAIQVLPPGPEKSQGQRVVIGDTAGVLQGFHFKNGQFCQIFKSVPSSRRISAVVTGRGQSQRDKVFIAEGSVVKAFDRKGVQFFRFTTPVSADIVHLEVVNSTLYAFAEHSVTVFEETTEKSFYLAPERIICATVVPMRAADGYLAALGCQDNCIRLLDGDHVVQEVLLDAAPTALTYCMLAHDAFNQHPTRKELLVGLSNGDMNQVFMDATTHHFGATLQSADRRGAINQLFSAFDMTGSGMNEIAVGREDGRFEVYDMDTDGTLQLVWETNVQQSIYGISGGNVTSLSHEEYIVHTFAGSILSFTAGTHTLAAVPAAAMQAADAQPPDKERQERLAAEVKAFEAEVRNLTKQVESKRAALAEKSAAMVASSQVLPLKHALKLIAGEGVHELTLEATVPIFCVAVEADARVAFLESRESAAILTTREVQDGGRAQSLATYRCHDSMLRVAIPMRVREGTPCTVTAYVVPKNAPKTCSRVVCLLHTLCLHRRARTADDTVPRSELEVTGDFSAAHARQWLLSCLPDMPKASLGVAPPLVYESASFGTQVSVTHGDGGIIASSDNPCALAALRESITRDATSAGTRIKVTNAARKETVAHFLRKLWPKLVAERDRAASMQLLDALEDVTNQESSKTFLTAKMQALLADGAMARNQFSEAGGEALLDFYLDQASAMYREWRMHQGEFDASKSAAHLLHLLKNKDTTLKEAEEFVLRER